MRCAIDASWYLKTRPEKQRKRFYCSLTNDNVAGGTDRGFLDFLMNERDWYSKRRKAPWTLMYIWENAQNTRLPMYKIWWRIRHVPMMKNTVEWKEATRETVISASYVSVRSLCDEEKIDYRTMWNFLCYMIWKCALARVPLSSLHIHFSIFVFEFDGNVLCFIM